MTRTPHDDLLKEALRRGQTIRLRAVSGSMVPTIRPGDLLYARNEPIQVGDIVVVEQEPDWLSHRLVALEPPWAWLCGDAPGATRHRVKLSDILGRVIAIQKDWRSHRQRLKRRVKALVSPRVWRAKIYRASGQR